jgi:hypothetical protein
MSRRALHWLVLSFATLWFGVLVPVHNRGQIGVAGSGECASGAALACHAPKPPCHKQSPHSAPQPARACAVCFFIAGLDAPPPVTVVETRLGPAGALDLPALLFPYLNQGRYNQDNEGNQVTTYGPDGGASLEVRTIRGGD